MGVGYWLWLVIDGGCIVISGGWWWLVIGGGWLLVVVGYWWLFIVIYGGDDISPIVPTVILRMVLNYANFV